MDPTASPASVYGRLKLTEHSPTRCWSLHQLLVSVKSLKSFYPSLKQRFPELYEASEYGSDKPRSVVVREGDHLRLRCAANGYPPPNVEWVREDEKTISTGAWEATSMPGHTLNITKVNRVHMGTYRCIADNGIPPAANQTYQVDVYCEYRTRITVDWNFPAPELISRKVHAENNYRPLSFEIPCDTHTDYLCPFDRLPWTFQLKHFLL